MSACYASKAQKTARRAKTFIKLFFVPKREGGATKGRAFAMVMSGRAHNVTRW